MDLFPQADSEQDDLSESGFSVSVVEYKICELHVFIIKHHLKG